MKLDYNTIFRISAMLFFFIVSCDEILPPEPDLPLNPYDCPESEKDECGLCDGPGILEGKCDCDGNVLDGCQVCGGGNADNLGCGCFEPGPSGCDDVCGSTLELDLCGVCDGDDTSCQDCAGVPNGDGVYQNYYLDNDGDGLGAGDPISLCTGLSGTQITIEQSGLVDNNSDPEPGCATNDTDCFNQCGGGAITDNCGVCQGDGSTCDPCTGIICEDNCYSGSTLYYNGSCSDGECSYFTQSCPHGCSDSECNPDPCIGISCESYCSGNSSLYYNGECSDGQCSYQSTFCGHGCDDGACNPDPCDNVVCEDYCGSGGSYYNGTCSNGECIFSYEPCSNGCTDGVCNQNSCAGVTCPSYCSGSYAYTNGYCSSGNCSYSTEYCSYGCSSGSCDSAPAGCGNGQVADCSGDGDCCSSSWIGDGYCDGPSQQYGCDLSCYSGETSDCDSGGGGGGSDACDGVNCSSFCSNGIYYYGGSCTDSGNCSYSTYTCPSGCNWQATQCE